MSQPPTFYKLSFLFRTLATPLGLRPIHLGRYLKIDVSNNTNYIFVAVQAEEPMTAIGVLSA
ncbi:hypothetical protein C1N51_08985 [Vibrio campbellii]|nr:hypothetical protein C1N51_08985 [Vibrio campbellii]